MPSAPSNERSHSLILIIFSHLLLFFPYSESINLQGQALLSWKNGLDGPIEALSSWNASDASACKWFGIRCGSYGEVVELSIKGVDLKGSLPSGVFFQQLMSLKSLVLSSTNLTGTIPRGLGVCSGLRVIDLSDNALSGEIPVELCRIRNLNSLSLNSNFLEGGIPSCIGNLSGLEYLTLYDNQLNGEIPRSIGELRNLQVFRVGGNQNIRGELPLEIGNCSSLIMLGLAETSISGRLPSSIGQLKRIQTIAIYTSLLSGSIPEEIGNCSELQNLYLYQNSLSGSIPKGIGKLGKLQSLLLWQNSLSGSIPDYLGGCTELMAVDLSENLLTGSIPRSFRNLLKLQELQLSVNQLSGVIPWEISECTALTHLEVDNNDISGEIPETIGNLHSLTLFFAWRNKLSGNIPKSLSNCKELEALDLSYNNLTGPIPEQIFGLRNLTKLLLLSNNLSGFVPPDIGNCTALYRLRLNGNNLGGTVPSQIGSLTNLNFLDLSNNRFVGGIPPSILGCRNLEFIDLHANGITGQVPDKLPPSLQFIDFSANSLSGSLTRDIGALTELTKLNLGKNQLSGQIPGEIASCNRLQMLDLSSNAFFDEIPMQLGLIPSLGISLNLSFNHLSGQIPSQFSKLTRLAILDLSHNNLTGNLDSLSNLQNLISLNISFNKFSGELPNTPFFRNLSLSNLASNDGLRFPDRPVDTFRSSGSNAPGRSPWRVAMLVLVAFAVILFLLAIYILLQARAKGFAFRDNEPWEMTLYQKMDFSINDILEGLSSSNVIGTGGSGVVYRIGLPNGESLAVKKMWSSEESTAFGSEIRFLGSIRHKNIIRLLGWGSNQHMNLLFYDYLPNGSLSSLLHGAGKGGAEWETRYDVVLGTAHALSYLHHDCVPAILHGDVKAMNVLLGPRFEPYLADFGLARTVRVNDDDILSMPSQQPHLAGSYGYMAPEHASMQTITEKSDVYSFGVVLMEVLTGRHPLDPTLPGGAHLVQWVRDHLSSLREPVDILDPKLIGRADPTMHEMLQTLAISLLCVSTKAADRPMMKDVVAMLKEIRHADTGRTDYGTLKEGLPARSSSSPRPMRSSGSQGYSNCSFVSSNESV